MIVSETRIKIKSLAKPALEALMLVGILILAFILGRISAFSENRTEPEVQVIYPPLVSTQVSAYQARLKPEASMEPSPQNEPGSDWAFAASKTGKVYYAKDCPGLSRVKPENRVYFASEAEAQAAGLSASAACQ